jgi:hypothetical protein
MYLSSRRGRLIRTAPAEMLSVLIFLLRTMTGIYNAINVSTHARNNIKVVPRFVLLSIAFRFVYTGLLDHEYTGMTLQTSSENKANIMDSRDG